MEGFAFRVQEVLAYKGTGETSSIEEGLGQVCKKSAEPGSQQRGQQGGRRPGVDEPANEMISISNQYHKLVLAFAKIKSQKIFRDGLLGRNDPTLMGGRIEFLEVPVQMLI